MDPDDLTTLHDGKFLRMVQRGKWEYVTRKNICGIVGIVAVTDEGNLILVEQYRPPLKQRIIEIPAGLAGDVPGAEVEDLALAAVRELEEETGYRAGRMEHLVTGAVSAGLSDEMVSLFRASQLQRVSDGGGDESEEIQVHEMPLGQVRAWLEERMKTGAVVDLKVYAALCFVER